MKAPVFIIGVGRSGTSLLQSMLNAHPEITFTPESHFFRKYCTKRKSDLENKGVNSFNEILSKDQEFIRLGLEPNNVLTPFIEKPEKFKLDKVYLRVLELYLNKKNKNIVGDKDPRNLDFLKEIKKYIPSAKIIHIYRDPRDLILSKTKAKWSSHRPVWQHAMIGQAQIKNGRKIGKKLFQDNYFEFSYETLIQESEATLKNICRFLEVNFHPQMMEYNTSSKELVSEKEIQWKKETFQPVMKNNKDKWKKELSQKQVSLIENISSEYFQSLGYEKSNIRENWILKSFTKVGVLLFEWIYIQFLSKRN